MSVLNNSLLLGQEGGAGYVVQRSVRFNSIDSAFLSRTPASAGNRKTWTFSLWVKRSAISTNNELFTAGTDVVNGPGAQIALRTGSDIRWTSYSGAFQLQLITTQVFRDPSAWYHLLFSVDTTQATAANRARIFVNGSQVTTFSTETYPSQNTDLLWNQAALQGIATNVTAAGSSYFDGYLADIHFIDGQALTPSSFAETNATTGQWVPKAYSGSYGTNGFQLKFADNSNNTAATLGKDTSGNGNNWTPNNLSVTAGAGNDSLVDTPSSAGTDTGLGGQVTGNYCTGNPIHPNLDAAPVTLSNGNLDGSITSGSNWYTGQCTIGVTTGKWYFEQTVNSGYAMIGIAPVTSVFTPNSDSVGTAANAVGYFNGTGQKFIGGSGSSYGAAYTTGDTVGCAFDMDAQTVTFYKNGVSQGVITGVITTGVAYAPCFSLNGQNGTGSYSWNFGQRPFAYPVSGFKCLCDTSLPAPVVAKSSDYFQTVLYTGNSSTQTISGLSFNPDLVFIKSRNQAAAPTWIDSVRGGTLGLFSSATNGDAGIAGITAFNSNGFTLGADNDGYTNYSGRTYVAWAFDAGTTTTTNTQGSITSSCRTNQSSGFSIVTYTGTLSGNGNATVGHGLGVAPQLVITKARSATSRWAVQMPTALSANNYLELNTTAAQSSWGTQTRANPTSTVFDTIYAGGVNESGVTYVAYCFAPVVGYSSFGSFVTNGADDNVFVYTGFRPRWIMWKRTDGANSWGMVDTARNTYNVVGNYLLANASDAEANSTLCDILSNGFKMRTSGFGNGQNYIYFAVAESPFQYARAR